MLHWYEVFNSVNGESCGVIRSDSEHEAVMKFVKENKEQKRPCNSLKAKKVIALTFLLRIDAILKIKNLIGNRGNLRLAEIMWRKGNIHHSRRKIWFVRDWDEALVSAMKDFVQYPE